MNGFVTVSIFNVRICSSDWTHYRERTDDSNPGHSMVQSMENTATCLSVQGEVVRSLGRVSSVCGPQTQERAASLGD